MASESIPQRAEKRTSSYSERLDMCKKHLLDELLVSEIKYLSYLRKIMQYFAEPLQAYDLLPSDLHDGVFGFIRQIISVNETLLESVLTLGIEEAFIMITPCLKLYADYARRYQTILAILETCSSLSHELRWFLEHQENSPDVKLQLPALLIMPIQRIPRYSLLFQELLMVCLQQDGLSTSHAYSCIEGILRTTREKNVVPEQVCAHILRMYECAQTRQPYPEDCELASDTMFLGHFLHTIRFRTARLLAAFSSISSTSTYLNELVRQNDEAAMTAFLQSRLFGCWTHNLLMVPGRRLLRYGLVDKRNELNGRRHVRLLILFSDILILATPRRVLQVRQLSVSTKLQRLNRKCKPHRRRRHAHRFSKRGRFVLFNFKHRRSMGRKVMEKSLRSSAGDLTTLTLGRPIDLLHDATIRFSRVAVYPLHHCRLERHFRQRNESDPYNLWKLPELYSAMSSPSTVATTQHSVVNDITRSSFHSLHRKQSLSTDAPLDYAFTVYCRGSYFTLVFQSRDAAEDSFSALTNAIGAVQFARQSLKKASSAKRPMPASDFIRYEQWLRTCERIENVRRIAEDEDFPQSVHRTSDLTQSPSSTPHVPYCRCITKAAQRCRNIFRKRIPRLTSASAVDLTPTDASAGTTFSHQETSFDPCLPPSLVNTERVPSVLLEDFLSPTTNPREKNFSDNVSGAAASTSSALSNRCPSRPEQQFIHLSDVDSTHGRDGRFLLRRNSRERLCELRSKLKCCYM